MLFATWAANRSAAPRITPDLMEATFRNYEERTPPPVQDCQEVSWLDEKPKEEPLDSLWREDE